MTCRVKAYVSPGLLRMAERANKMKDHGPLCPSCFSDPDQGWDRWQGRCVNCGHVITGRAEKKECVDG